MNQCNDKQKIREHYDLLTPYYHALWGEHIHHGYWIRGNESRPAAQVQLVEHLAKTARIPSGCKVLDVGCGVGASSIYLAHRYQAQVTGITISPVQLEMASRAASRHKTSAKFLLMDAENMTFNDGFDVLWSIESISHYQDVPRFFASSTKLLKPTGTIALIDWFQRHNLTEAEHAKFIAPIEKSMLVKLHTMGDYCGWMRKSGLHVTTCEVLNKQCARTWDICLEIIKDAKLWELAAKHGPQFLTYLRGFRAMRAGFASGAFVYGLLVARKPG
jgi:tocopherol O-methyltransferase